ncbi:hypothetical protein HJC23_013277 [Cyclotella cryptica]|uniref:ATP-dependent DNA ligase family profile domain-containing protein n=1 Tax=Cyclotella cryptica TaxID=29204 RepID=A0ABD3P7M7_9STRA
METPVSNPTGNSKDGITHAILPDILRFLLKDIAHRHRELDKVLPASSRAKSSLALNHPAFACEIKMDGERMLVHIKRGIVTMHTRRNVWYSPLYSPAIGPALRAAISRYDVDVILDGEIVAWDAYENKAVPFGTNRAVAELRRNQREMDGTLDARDCNLHRDARDANVMSLSKDKLFKHLGSYVIFDILYVDGPGAMELISKSGDLFPQNEAISTGSIVNFDLMRRKSILYNLIVPQEHEVELIPSVIVRSDGSSMDAKDYFSDSKTEYGKSSCAMDSILLAILSGRSHEEIEIQRALAMEQCYRQIVENSGQEGLLLKDLSSPYYLGAASRSLRYWFKLKPDYDASGQASDVDVLVLGGKYASGFRKAGYLSSLLVGIIDDRMGVQEENVKYLTLCKVTFTRDIEKVMRTTGFQKADGDRPLQLGKWFEANDTSLPDSISEWSFQRSPRGDRDGWKPNKKDRPDLWINPEDSFVLTLNSAEIIASDSMSAGLCLRFPRITSIRAEGFDKGPKPHDEVQTFTELSTLFIEKEDQDVEPMEFGSQAHVQSSRFLTAKHEIFSIPSVDKVLSHALDGLTFTVLPGTFHLESDSFAAAEAKENGWIKEARTVTSREDVIRFIKSHGGKCELSSHVGSDFILGGSIQDPKVAIYSDLITATNELDIASTTTKRDAQARRFFEMGDLFSDRRNEMDLPFLHRLKILKCTAGHDKESIKQKMPVMARPRRSDYLLMTKSAATALNDTEDEHGLRIDEVSNMIDFKRALEVVGRNNSAKRQRVSPLNTKATSTWQSTAISSIEECDRWVFRCKLQKLWPYKKDSTSRCRLSVVYPDVFIDVGLEEEEDAGNDENNSNGSRWDNSVARGKRQGSVLAVLPLLQVMGAEVATHLHSGVTHILCEMKSKSVLKWSSTLPRSVFANIKAGSLLHQRLLSLEESAALSGKEWTDVMLVSPEWVEKSGVRVNVLRLPQIH